MATQTAGPRLVGIILAVVVLFVLLGLLIYLVWREANPKPKTVPQRASAVQPILPNYAELLL
jgi:hypothetical protein